MITPGCTVPSSHGMLAYRMLIYHEMWVHNEAFTVRV
jgi:hypothetical protein